MFALTSLSVVLLLAPQELMLQKAPFNVHLAPWVTIAQLQRPLQFSVHLAQSIFHTVRLLYLTALLVLPDSNVQTLMNLPLLVCLVLFRLKDLTHAQTAPQVHLAQIQLKNHNHAKMELSLLVVQVHAKLAQVARLVLSQKQTTALQVLTHHQERLIV